MDWKELASVEEVPIGKMKKFAVGPLEITVARTEKGIYAFGDRCPHMNAPLHEGKIDEDCVVCPLHKTKFELATGRRMSDPKIPIPKALKMGAMMANIRTHDLQTFSLKEEGGRILVNIDRRRA